MYFLSIGLPNPPVEGLFSGCALGILHNDLQLAHLVLQELQKYQHNPKYTHHIAFFTSQFQLKNVRRNLQTLCNKIKLSRFKIFLSLFPEYPSESTSLPPITSALPSRQHTIAQSFNQFHTPELPWKRETIDRCQSNSRKYHIIAVD